MFLKIKNKKHIKRHLTYKKLDLAIFFFLIKKQRFENVIQKNNML